jgi:hypothetical protein
MNHVCFHQREHVVAEVRKMHATGQIDSQARYNAACAPGAPGEKREILNYLRIRFRGDAVFRRLVKNDLNA